MNKNTNKSDIEQKYKILSELTSDASFINYVDKNGNITTEFVGGNIKGLTGYSFEEFEKLGGREGLIIADDLFIVKNQIKSLLENKPATVQYRIKKKNGDIEWLEDIGYGIFDKKEKRVTTFYNSIRSITREKRAYSELSESKQKYETLYKTMKIMSDNAIDMIWTKDKNNKFTFVNKVVAEKLLNAKDTEEPIGKNEMYFIKRERNKHKNDKDWYSFGEECQNSDEIVKKTGKSGRFNEYGNVMGKFMFLDVYKAPLKDDNGKITGTVGYARDITELKKYEKELKDTVERFRNYLNFMPVAIFVFDKNGNIKEVNSAFEKITRKKEEELKGVNIKNFIKPDNLEGFDKGLKILTMHGSVNGQGRFVVNDAEKFISYHGIKLDDNTYLAVLFDITQQKLTDKALKINEQRYRTVFENLPNIAVQAYDKNRKAIFWNETSTKIYGYTKEEALGKEFEELIIPDDRKEAAKNLIDKWINGKSLAKPGEYRRKRKDNTIFYVYSTLIQIINYLGEKEIFALDIDLSPIKETENKLKKALSELEELNKTKDKIFSIIGHDLRSPFNSLLGFTELLSAKFHDFSEEEKYTMIKVLRKNSLQAYNLLNNILEWSRQQMGAISYQPSVVFIKNIFDEVISYIEINADEKDITIENKINPHHFAFVDKGSIAVVIRNLLSNAIKFTPKNGKITINSNLINTNLWVSITDTGMGIKKEVIDKLLSGQGEYTSTGTEGEKGTGLGLILCKNFLKMNKGELKIESEPGKGSTFSFRLPIYQ